MHYRPYRVALHGLRDADLELQAERLQQGRAGVGRERLADVARVRHMVVGEQLTPFGRQPEVGPRVVEWL
ncbi:hypothetical protein RZS08_10355, partial [Arthrospira platensis SPKY1]|nr:hypothetical protein [Arthrospira platensis SPKY1]